MRQLWILASNYTLLNISLWIWPLPKSCSVFKHTHTHTNTATQILIHTIAVNIWSPWLSVPSHITHISIMYIECIVYRFQGKTKLLATCVCICHYACRSAFVCRYGYYTRYLRHCVLTEYICQPTAQRITVGFQRSFICRLNTERETRRDAVRLCNNVQTHSIYIYKWRMSEVVHSVWTTSLWH